MKFISSEISDVIIVEPDVFGDSRGFFMETWQSRKFAEAGIDAHFEQDNWSRSEQGVLRGLHYQIKQPQGKLIQVINGAVFDVAVDLRKKSLTFGKWVGIIVSDENKRLMWIPPGFAHGFYVLSEQVDLYYKCTDFYAQEHERSVRWNDPDLSISWPLIDGQEPVLSSRDSSANFFRDAEVYE